VILGILKYSKTFDFSLGETMVSLGDLCSAFGLASQLSRQSTYSFQVSLKTTKKNSLLKTL